MAQSFVPPEFTVPVTFEGDGFRLEPLGSEHNELDYAAWMSSIDHIHSTPGFEQSNWPKPMSLDANLADLERHARDFTNRDGFTYSIIDGDEVIGCVYIYPSRTRGHDATVVSWVRESRSDMDITVWRDLSAWLATHWPFTKLDYAPRE
ncbi:MAG: N-acetyltransferase [Acidobacteria bacterium]|nr:N-acetyltransferase [Acidobacteriota bacterium]